MLTKGQKMVKWVKKSKMNFEKWVENRLNN